MRLFLSLFLAGACGAWAQSAYQTNADFAKYAMKLRESALSQIEPQVIVPTNARPSSGIYPWKLRIVTTVFWCGEAATTNNPVSNRASSWDLNWATTYGGYDNPEPSARRNYIPVAFTPRLNPFYIALPYNDVTHTDTKPEASRVIPWFATTFIRSGQSVCHDRWIAIRAHGRVCYAQWSDCGPFRTDHWAYVFGTENPLPNLNHGAGLDVSPAVRDYLGLVGMDVTDWKFVEFRDVPRGPWAQYGENNTFVQLAKGSVERIANAAPVAVSAAAPAPVASRPAEGPRVVVK